MPLFQYRAVAAEGRVSGEIVADTARAARSILREDGLRILSLSEARVRAGRRLDLPTLAAVLRQVGVLVRAGFPVVRALEAAAVASLDARVHATLAALDSGVRAGKSLSQAMAESGAFPEAAVGTVRAGETAGNLADVLLELSRLFERELDTRRRVRTALTYPIVVLAVAAGVLLFLLGYVVPTFRLLFEESQVPLPLPTVALLETASFVRDWGWLLLLLGAGGAWGIRRRAATPTGRARLEARLAALPMVGEIYLKATAARWARLLSVMLDGGVPLVEALRISRSATGSARLSAALDSAAHEVSQGVTLRKALTHAPLPPLVLEAIAVGEEGGNLPEMLHEVATAFDQEVAARSEALASALEPALIVVMGAVVGAIVLAILLPIFELQSTIQ